MKKILTLACAVMCMVPSAFSQRTDALETPYAPGEVLIQLRHGYNIDQVTAAFPGAYDVKVVKCLSKNMRFWQLSFNNSFISNNQLLDKLDGMPFIRLAQNNHYVQERATVPNDPNLTNQWHHVNAGGGGGTADADIDSDLAWDITTGGTTAHGDEIVVCIVEGGGANYSHPDLLANFWQNPGEIAGNGIDDDGNGYIDDKDGWNVNANNDNHATGGHGTNCMGMIGAVGNNSVGVVGANWNVKMMLVSGFSVNESNVIEAYDYPLTMRKMYNQTNGASGAFVVATSSSWGIDNANPASYPLWCAFYDTLGVHGILNPASTTNNTANVDVVGDMPTACSSDYMLSVTRTGNTDNQAGGYGATTVDFGAPGINVYTTSGTSSYTTTTGTSFSCPLTAGVIGLMYSVPCNSFMNLVKADPQAGADLVRQYLIDGVDPVASMAGISVTGGRLNAFNAVNLLMTNCSTSACPQPFGLTVSGVSTGGANIAWTDGGTADDFYYYIRPVGSGTWDSTLVSSGTSATLGGLAPCIEYEVMVAAVCSGDLSDYSTIATFTTDGCCTPPTGVTVTNVDPTTVSVSFAPVTAAVSYNVQYKEISSAIWTTINSTTIPVTISGLDACSSYEVQVQTVCASSTTAFTTSVTFNTTGCGACEDLTYCATIGESVADEFIAGVQIGSINRTSGADGGYIFTGLSTALNIGVGYPITLTPGYTGSAYDERFTVWIDYNQDGVFADPAEKAYDPGVAGNVAVSGTVTIPATATVGPTRMRVSMKYIGGSDTGVPTPCLTFDYGEIEDYCVDIQPATGVAESTDPVMVYHLYPNPAANIVTLDVYNYADLAQGQPTLDLVNAMGQVVKRVNLNGKSTVVDLNAMAPGVYSYVINLSETARRTGRIIVAR